ncbi:DUF4260 domain-containing protein [Brevundimonas sp.]|uniref:DUF4260 domain-containing protein n=1 Tax=Brevundimonas sp. TaxID=1871086 RepID=UPI002ABA3350|nr:DUF4260 domain-containing protein [Brevundimonas sp.]MDZ4365402.1 DUF4260 domain-containing protein [Brevundimonas sp.]
MTGPIRQEGGGVRGWPLILLRMEGLAILALTVFLYQRTGASWWLFAGLFLVPDLSFLAYAIGRGAGTVAYNMTHSEVGPVILAAAGLTVMPVLLPIALIWGAHVGWDRMLGYGLKYATSFDHTHLGPIGKAARLKTS